MANQTVTTAVNHDSAGVSGLGNGENYTINGGSVTINGDTRWGQNAAAIGAVTLSATLGGSLYLDGTAVWWIPFDASSGNVPALGTVGTDDVTVGGSNVGEFLGIFTALGVAPTAAAAAIPASGFVKLRSKSATIADDDTLTFAGGGTVTVNSTTGGVRGWIHAVFEENNSITVPRLGLAQCRGDWFYLGTTDGNDNQTFQYPVADSCPAIWVETGAGTDVYEIWLNAGDRWGDAAQYVATDARGKFFGCVAATGVITIARTSSNTCGFKPPTGCKVRIPNVIVSVSSSADWTANIAGTNQIKFYTNASGQVDLEYTVGNWNWKTINNVYTLRILHSAANLSISGQSNIVSIYLEDVGVGLLSSTQAASGAIYLFDATDVTIKDCSVIRHHAADAIKISDSTAVALDGVTAYGAWASAAVLRSSGTWNAITLSNVTELDITDCTLIGGSLSLATCSAVTVTRLTFADVMIGTTGTANGIYVIKMATCDDVSVDTIALLPSLSNVHPYLGIFYVATTNDLRIRNIGTAAAMFDGGSANLMASFLKANTGWVGTLIASRVYVTNLRSAFLEGGATYGGVTLANCWGALATSMAMAFGNAVCKGCGWTYSVVNAYGSHWIDVFNSTTAGVLAVTANEPTALTADQCSITAGTPRFTGAYSVSMPTEGDQVTWEMPYWCLGYTAFTNSAPTIAGTDTGNLTLEYQIDTGSGYGAWTALTAVNLSAETISETTGFKLKIRATTASAAATTVLSNIRIAMTTTATAYLTQYSLPGATVVVSGLVAGSRVRVERVDTGAYLTQGYSAGTTVTLDVPYTGAVLVEARNASGTPAYKPWSAAATITEGKTTDLTALQEED